MASRLIVPFDFNPASTTIKTSSYTVPAGKYARIVPYSGILLNSVATTPTYTVSGSGTTSITSIDVFSGTGSYVAYTLTKTAAGSQPRSLTMYTLFPDGATAGTTFQTGVTTLFSTTTPGSSTGTVFIPAGMHFRASVGGNIGQAVSYSLVVTKVETEPFWVKSGDIIDGNRFLVEEYNAIS
jgi:hypothetical protein